MNRLAPAAAAVFLSFALAACQSPFGGSTRTGQQVAVTTPPPAAVNSAAAINGRWIPTDEATRGAYYAQFNNGSFVSRDPQSNAAIAQGSYRVTSETGVELDFVGAASGKRITATCQRSAPDRMTCTPTVGGTFSLQRTGAS